MTHVLMSEPPLLVFPQLACQIGVYESMVLQQVHYWLNPRFNKHCFEGKLWVHNTIRQWHKQFPFISEKTLQRIFSRLESQKILEGGYFNKSSWDRTKWYTINYDVLNKTLENKDFSSIFPKGDISDTDVDKSISSGCLNGEPLDEDMDCLSLRISYIDTEIPSENTTEKGIQENAQSGQKGKSQESSESEFVFQAYDCWRQLVGCKTQLSQARREKLAELLENHFATLETWKSFCEQIRNTPFLMGQNRKHWRITLEWLLNPINFQKVQDGNYQDTPPVQAAEGRSEHSDDLKMHIKANLLEHELSQNLHDPRLELFVKDLRAYQGDARFISWNHSLWFFIEGDILQIMCDSAFQIASMQDRYGQDYEKASHKAGFKGVILQTSREFTKNNPGVRHAS